MVCPSPCLSPYTADRRRFHLIELLTTLLLGLAAAASRTPGPAERALGAPHDRLGRRDHSVADHRVPTRTTTSGRLTWPTTTGRRHRGRAVPDHR